MLDEEKRQAEIYLYNATLNGSMNPSASHSHSLSTTGLLAPGHSHGSGTIGSNPVFRTYTSDRTNANTDSYYRTAGDTSMATLGNAVAPLTLFEVTIVDSRIESDGDAVDFFSVRSATSEGARLAALLRGGFSEADMKYINIFVQGRGYVKDVDPLDDEECE